MACALAPAVTPLWASGVAMLTAFAQWCPGRSGMLLGKRSVTVGTTQLTSPTSVEPTIGAPWASSGSTASQSGTSRRGTPARGVHVMSGFRTPQYNRAGGDPRGRAGLSRHMFGDATDLWIDNDGDGLVDGADPDCQVGPTPEGPPGDASCTDGLDNDGDGLVDGADGAS